LVVDPVMISTSGRRLLQADAVKTLKRELLPLATVVTPNVAEAEVLTGKKIATVEDLREAARTIHELFGCAALVKGGHLRGADSAVDALCAKEGEWLVSAPRMDVKALHGTGCVYSAAIAAWLARGKPLRASVELAKRHITRQIAAQL
jgi:hydroxymethylpyrimidine/phosphomethylpyrimidine kinase